MSRGLLALLIGILLLAGACSSGGPEGGSTEPRYTPVADETLFSRVTDQPGVERADLSFNDGFPDKAYAGEVFIAPDADAQAVLDTVYATLRQGRPDVAINITGYQSGRDVRLDALPRSGGPVELEKRYGPQPGDGTPPSR